MPKAILELEMPESCKTCPIKRYLHYGWVEHICGITGEQCQEKGRRSDCPLKLVDKQTNVKCRYCNSESVEIIASGTESILYKCKACKMEFAKLKEVGP